MRPPVPPFTQETALQKVKAAQALWNTKDPVRVAEAYTPDTVWRNRDQFVRHLTSVRDLRGFFSADQGYAYMVVIM
jgi:nuclear transport factor 2 (NTF2) superfamily protein